MGLFKSFKKMFSNDINPDTNKFVGVVYPYPIKQIKVNSKIIVPENYYFCLGANGKTLDGFSTGTYYLSPTTLPETCKKLKIHKTDEHGHAKKSFKANVYFIKLLESEIKVKTFDKVELGSKSSGIFSVGMQCNIKYSVSDPKKFLSFLLSQFSYLKIGEGEKILQEFSSDNILKIFSTYNFALSEFLANNMLIVDNLMSELSKKYNKIGLTLIEIYNENYLLPRKYQKQYSLNKQQNVEKTIQPDLEKQVQDEYSPFGNMKIEEIEQEDLNSNLNKNEDDFVDLNLDNLYNDKKD